QPLAAVRSGACEAMLRKQSALTHGGSMAASMPPTVLPAHATPPLTDFRDLMDPRHAWMNLHRVRVFR
ncbi:hypothetical protein, partial [Stenotrophomonas maltophilia]|uniref:hypothetical protein n=1 Tax=Stenotrophomonas maltophilia TaxID=40324 RepID=UPI001C3E0DDA